MLFEKIVTTQPLISYDIATQICAIGGGNDFYCNYCFDCRGI